MQSCGGVHRHQDLQREGSCQLTAKSTQGKEEIGDSLSIHPFIRSPQSTVITSHHPFATCTYCHTIPDDMLGKPCRFK